MKGIYIWLFLIWKQVWCKTLYKFFNIKEKPWWQQWSLLKLQCLCSICLISLFQKLKIDILISFWRRKTAHSSSWEPRFTKVVSRILSVRIASEKPFCLSLLLYLWRCAPMLIGLQFHPFFFWKIDCFLCCNFAAFAYTKIWERKLHTVLLGNLVLQK